jgi:hypothetical protein
MTGNRIDKGKRSLVRNTKFIDQFKDSKSNMINGATPTFLCNSGCGHLNKQALSHATISIDSIYLARFGKNNFSILGAIFPKIQREVKRKLKQLKGHDACDAEVKAEGASHAGKEPINLKETFRFKHVNTNMCCYFLPSTFFPVGWSARPETCGKPEPWQSPAALSFLFVQN